MGIDTADVNELVVNVVVPPDGVAVTKSAGLAWVNCKIVAALAEVASASEASAPRARNRIDTLLIVLSSKLLKLLGHDEGSQKVHGQSLPEHPA